MASESNEAAHKNRKPPTEEPMTASGKAVLLAARCAAQIKRVDSV